MKPKAHNHVHNSPPLVPVPSQLNPAHTLESRFFKIYFNIILISIPDFRVIPFL
jgi:hypothetical protein